MIQKCTRPLCKFTASKFVDLIVNVSTVVRELGLENGLDFEANHVKAMAIDVSGFQSGLKRVDFRGSDIDALITNVVVINFSGPRIEL